MSNRRDFIKRVSIVGLAAGLTPQLLHAKDNAMKGDGKRSMRIAHITDVHMIDRTNAETYFSKVLRELNAMKDNPDLIINTGDTVMDENKQTRETVQARWNSWNKIVTAENKIPMKSVLGNHDVWYGPDDTLDAEYKKDKRYGKQWAIDELKMPHRYYSFEMRGWYFIGLDSINGEDGYQLDDEQFAWLENELVKAQGKPVLVFNHVPIMSMGALLYYTKRKPLADVKFPSGDMHNDHQRLKDLFFKNRNVKVCLSGHVHYIDAVDYLGVKYLCNGAVSGNWWGSPLALDEFPPVYSLLDLYPDGSCKQQLVYYVK